MKNKQKLIDDLEKKKHDFKNTNNMNHIELIVYQCTLQEIIDEIKKGKYETACSSCFDNIKYDEKQ